MDRIRVSAAITLPSNHTASGYGLPVLYRFLSGLAPSALSVLCHPQVYAGHIYVVHQHMLYVQMMMMHTPHSPLVKLPKSRINVEICVDDHVERVEMKLFTISTRLSPNLNVCQSSQITRF